MGLTTKKLLVAVEMGVRKARNNEFLVPCCYLVQDNMFIGIESKKPAGFGAVSYIGKEINSEEVVERYLENCREPVDKGELKSMMEEYMRELQNFKIGNAVRIQYREGGSFSIVKVADSPPLVEVKPKLP